VILRKRWNLNLSRTALRKFRSRFGPTAPFASGLEHKGVWSAVARAQSHIWRNYQVTLPTQDKLRGTLRLIVLSDLHVGSHSYDLDRISQIVEEVALKQFDILLLPGDFINMQVFGGGRIQPERIASVLEPLTQKVKTFAVLGNHDAEYGLEHVEQCLTSVGIQVLQNRWSRCVTNSGALYIVGLEDESTGAPDFETASKGTPNDAPLLVLAHDPASAMYLPDRAMLVVSGHTHGGQVRLPWFGPLINSSQAPLAWSQGHVRLGLRHLVVSAGLGTSILPFRFNCPPEILEIELATTP